MEIAKIWVDGTMAAVVSHRPITAGLSGCAIVVEYLPGIWDGLTKTVVFRGAETKDVVTNDSIVAIPAETIAEPRKRLEVGVFGVDADKKLIVPTVWVDLGVVLPAADPSGDTSTDTSLPVWAQLADDLRDLEERVENFDPGVTPGPGGDIDLTGYATEEYVQEYAQPKGNYLTEVPAGYAKTEDVPKKPEDIGAEPAGTAAESVSQHNTAEGSHNDIRQELKSLSDRLAAFFDTDDKTLDELSEIVAYITNNKTLIDSITTSKVNVTDIVNNLTTNVANKPLSAAQGVVLKGLIDTVTNSLATYQPKGDYALRSEIPTKVSQLQNDNGYLTQHQDISGKLDANELPEAINTALAQAKASGEFNGQNGQDGQDGQRGTGILKVTTTPTSYTTTTAGIAPIKRMSLSTIKSEANVDEVLAGDQISHSYYLYRIYYTDATYAYMDKSQSIRGATGSNGSAGKDGAAGTSVTVSGVTESTESGGSNVVSFSDGKSVTILNGKDGKDAGSYTIPDFWKDALDTAIARVKSLQVGRNCVTFPFFSDNHQRNGYAGVLIAEAMKQCGIPFCFYGGDSISSGTIADEATMIAQDKAFDDMMSVVPNGRLCRAVGNHDGYWYDGTNKFYYDRNQVYELFLREESIAQNKHFGNDGTYYYVEDLVSRVRFIVLNTNGGSVDDAQIAWFRDVALNVEEGWAVVMISHQPISNHYHALISNAADVRAVAVNSGAEIIGWFSGHIHRDRIYTGAAVNTEDDSEGADLGFTQVTITSDYTSIAYDDATKHAVKEDALSHAIDFVTINRNTKKVYLTRLGIGNSREYRYGAEPEPSYINLADISDKTDNSLTEGYRIGSSGTSSSSTATPAPICTNYVPCVSGDIIRVKNLTLGGFNVGFYKSGKTVITSGKPTFPFTGSYYTAEIEGDVYKFKIISGDCEWIRFCGVLTGTVDDVIITKNQPIV